MSCTEFLEWAEQLSTDDWSDMHPNDINLVLQGMNMAYLGGCRSQSVQNALGQIYGRVHGQVDYAKEERRRLKERAALA